MTKNYRYRGSNSNRLHSQSFWNRDLIDAIRVGDRDGFYFFDDFQSGGAVQSSTAHTWTGGSPGMRYLTYATASTTCKPSRTSGDYEIGVLECAGNDADNDEFYLTFDNTYTEGFGRSSTTAAAAFPWWFEARVRYSNVSNLTGKFVGMYNAGDAATGDIANGSASLADNSYLGFRSISTSPTYMDAIYRNSGGSSERTAYAASSYSSLVIAASTWVKYGLFWDGSYLHYYINGAEVGTGVLATATDFPDGDVLMPRIMLRSEEAISGQKLGVDWWSFMRLDELRI